VNAEFVIGSYDRLYKIEKIVPDGHERPAGPPGLPPPPRLDRGPAGADNLVTAVDLVLSCWTMEAKFGIRLQECPTIRHCQYLCCYDSLTWWLRQEILTLCLQSTFTLSLTAAGLSLDRFFVRLGRSLSGLVVSRNSQVGSRRQLENWPRCDCSTCASRLSRRQ
jgi:hypothetical protein